MLLEYTIQLEGALFKSLRFVIHTRGNEPTASHEQLQTQIAAHIGCPQRPEAISLKTRTAENTLTTAPHRLSPHDDVVGVVHVEQWISPWKPPLNGHMRFHWLLPNGLPDHEGVHYVKSGLSSFSVLKFKELLMDKGHYNPLRNRLYVTFNSWVLDDEDLVDERKLYTLFLLPQVYSGGELCDFLRNYSLFNCIPNGVDPTWGSTPNPGEQGRQPFKEEGTSYGKISHKKKKKRRKGPY